MRIRPENVYFVLVEPQTPGNVGAAARALKTMGFSNLVLVNPCDYLSPEARWLAHASEDILESARVVNSLEEAVAEMHFVVATTQRTRGLHLPYYTARELAEKAVPITAEHTVAVVFGREDSGLTNHELTFCDAISTIPAQVKHPSLNLAQAVMLYAYEFFQVAYGEERTYHWRLANRSQLEALYRHLRQSLEKIGFQPIDNWENFLMRFARLMGRANAEVRDVNVWHKILDEFDFYIKHLEEKIARLEKKTGK